MVVRQRISDGVFASIRDGQFVFVECRGGAHAEQLLSGLLADPAQWMRYKGLQSVAVPFAQLNGATQRQVLQALFRQDVLNDAGWWHIVSFAGEQGQETLQSIADWFTGDPRNAPTILKLPENKAANGRLQKGQRIYIPAALLRPSIREGSAPAPTAAPQPAPENLSNRVAAAPEMRPATPQPQPAPQQSAPRQQAASQQQPAPTQQAAPQQQAKKNDPAPRGNTRGRRPGRAAEQHQPPGRTAGPQPPARTQPPQPAPAAPKHRPRAEEGEGTAEPAQLQQGELIYGKDAQGPYAAYKLKRGEAIYTSVVARFTDFQSSEDINRACNIVLKRSGITDARNIDVGQSIRIPMEMLRDRYWPEDSTQRKEFEAMRKETARVKETRVASAKGLSDVTVIIDPGHGGNDHGAMHEASGLYEDELNYDIAMRLKRVLETTTQARVFVTMQDPKQGFEPRSVNRFTPDKNEELLTTPRYWNEDAKISANLRWYLTNAIYARELKNGRDPRKVLFISIHCDALHEKMRGTMIYVPGAKYRRDREHPEGTVYARYAETNNHAPVTCTASDRTRDEALSRNFAQAIIDSLQNHDPKIAVSKHGDPIRNVIRQGDGRAYVPAVLRNNLVPTKVLVETANLNNAQDRERLSDPLWRQWYADAILKAIRAHFKS